MIVFFIILLSLFEGSDGIPSQGRIASRRVAGSGAPRPPAVSARRDEGEPNQDPSGDILDEQNPSLI
jgi:hypothetical protein